MEAAQSLRVAQPDPQTEFPFAEEAARQALAIPAADLDLWRGRGDVIKNPGFVAVRFNLRDDPRFAHLAQLCEAKGMLPEYGLLVLIMSAGYALTLDQPGLFACRGLPVGPTQIRRFWHIHDLSAAAFDLALRQAEIARWLTRGNLDDDVFILPYGRARTRDRARSRATVDVDVDVDGRGQTSGRNSQAQPLQPPPPPVAGPVATTTNGRSQKSADDDDADGPKATGDSGGAVHTRGGVKSPRDINGAAATIGERLLVWRKANSKMPYPLTQKDFLDIREATACALRTNRIEELTDLFSDTARWADDGKGFRIALREAGFLGRGGGHR